MAALSEYIFPTSHQGQSRHPHGDKTIVNKSIFHNSYLASRRRSWYQVPNTSTQVWEDHQEIAMRAALN